MVCSIFISNASPTQAIGRQSFVSSSPSCCGSTFGMDQKSRFAGDNVMLGTKNTKRKEYFMITRIIYHMRKEINASGVMSLGAVGYEVFHDSNVKSSNVLDAAMGAISFVPGWGWIAGGIYFGADIVTKLSTGKSIGEHLDAAIEERYDIDNGVLLEW